LPRQSTALAEGLPVSRPAVSQPLKVLTEAGLITERRDGTRRLYAANPRALGELRAAIEAMWHEALARMAAAIDKEQEG
jgi:DNA-binding transcriptional ArsR family regulator